MSPTAWRYTGCSCSGGFMRGADGYPESCGSCAGNGGVYVTEKGARALYPGGPFFGRDSDHREWERGVPWRAPLIPDDVDEDEVGFGMHDWGSS